MAASTGQRTILTINENRTCAAPGLPIGLAPDWLTCRTTLARRPRQPSRRLTLPFHAVESRSRAASRRWIQRDLGAERGWGAARGVIAVTAAHRGGPPAADHPMPRSGWWAPTRLALPACQARIPTTIRVGVSSRRGDGVCLNLVARPRPRRRWTGPDRRLVLRTSSTCTDRSLAFHNSRSTSIAGSTTPA